MEGYEDSPDTSPIVNFACGDINLCAESGYGVDSAALNLYLSEGSTANEINNALGFECFDPITCEILYEAPVPIVGEIQSSSQAQNLLIACFPPDPTTGAMNSELMFIFPQINVQPYPIMWDDFNAFIGFNCLNSNAEVATPYVEPSSGFEEDIVDDSGDIPDPITGSDDVEDAVEDPLENFSGFVSSLNNSEEGGCTDPLASNYDEGVEFDNGSCDY